MLRSWRRLLAAALTGNKISGFPSSKSFDKTFVCLEYVYCAISPPLKHLDSPALRVEKRFPSSFADEGCMTCNFDVCIGGKIYSVFRCASVISPTPVTTWPLFWPILERIADLSTNATFALHARTHARACSACLLRARVHVSLAVFMSTVWLVADWRATSGMRSQIQAHIACLRSVVDGRWGIWFIGQLYIHLVHAFVVRMDVGCLSTYRFAYGIMKIALQFAARCSSV